MDQQTIIILVVVGIIAFLGFMFLVVLGGLFMWFAAKRRANPRVRDVRGAKKNGQVKPCGCLRGIDCECGQPPAERCVSARMPYEDDRPVAIFGVAQDECCNDGKLTQKQVQRFVDLDNEVRDKELDDQFVSRAERVFARFRGSQGGANNDDPIPGDFVG